MQDNYQNKQLGLIYEAMTNPSSTPTQSKTLQFNGKYTGPLTLRFDMAALQPFISNQNNSLEDFLAAIGIPDHAGEYSSGPAAFLTTMETVDLVKMLNKFAGTSFGYDDTDLELVPNTAETLDYGDDDEDDDDNEEDAEEMDDRPTPIVQVYKLVRDLAAKNPGKEPAGSLSVFNTYSKFVNRAKALVDRIDNWR